jgi:hypothetical protein
VSLFGNDYAAVEKDRAGRKGKVGEAFEIISETSKYFFV